MTAPKDGFSSEQLASRALAAACQRDRAAVVTLLAKYGATKLTELRLKDLQPFTRECEAIPEPPPAPLPPVEMIPAFAIGERVRHMALCKPMRVTGYQLRYVVDGGRCVRAETLERVEAPPAPPVPPPPPSPVGYVYLSEVPFGHIVERYTNKVEYFVSASRDGTGNRVMTTLNGVPKDIISQEELVRDLGPVRVTTSPPPAPGLRISEWELGHALYEAAYGIGFDKLGKSFATNASELQSVLIARGMRVMRI